MSNISARVLAALLLSCVFANTYALAQTAQAVPAAPTPVERNGVTYITGASARTKSARSAKSRRSTTCASRSRRRLATIFPTST